MESLSLIDPSTAGVPAPLWFVEFFKCLGFTLHMAPMNLWYAGLLVALWLHLRGGEHGKRFAARLIQQMPVIVALGINFGIVPLLFVQLAYYKFFYPATILMAWAWLAIIGLLIPAYYGVYAYAWGLRNGQDGMAGWRVAAGWLAAALFCVIGFVFANAMSLMEHVERWRDLWNATNVHGAALGIALNVGDPTLWPRWLLMFGLALGTTAVWLLVDVFYLDGGTTRAYRSWAIHFAKSLYTLGLLWAATAGGWYVLGAWSDDLNDEMLLGPMIYLTLLTGMSPGLPWALIANLEWCSQHRQAEEGEPDATGRCARRRLMIAVIALCQFGVLALNAVSRQVVQNTNLKLEAGWNVMAQPENVQWGPLVTFLVVFVLGLLVVAWMLAQLRHAKPA